MQIDALGLSIVMTDVTWRASEWFVARARVATA